MITGRRIVLLTLGCAVGTVALHTVDIHATVRLFQWIGVYFALFSGAAVTSIGLDWLLEQGLRTFKLYETFVAFMIQRTREKRFGSRRSGR